ncbi:MAG: HupE/UreJ family protein [Bacteroidota bacterium]
MKKTWFIYNANIQKKSCFDNQFQTTIYACKLLLGLIVAYWLFFPTSVFAHDNTVTGAGAFISGLTHPVLGFDHLLAMLSVGILSAQIGGRAVWLVPLTFVGVMVVGGGIGLTVDGFPFTEIGIALSVVILGVAIASDTSTSMRIALIAVSLFALFHGYAHGVEIPHTDQPDLYIFGFMAGTTLIHIAGLVIGDISQHYDIGKTILRIGGGIIAFIGVLFLFGIL